MNRLLRAAFILYALVLTIATHRPQPEVHGPFQRTDLVIHVAAFFTATILLYASRLLGPLAQWRTVALTMLIALAWAALDEWTQQFVQRITASDDFAANAAGVWLGSAAAACWCARGQRTGGGHAAEHG